MSRRRLGALAVLSLALLILTSTAVAQTLEADPDDATTAETEVEAGSDAEARALAQRPEAGLRASRRQIESGARVRLDGRVTPRQREVVALFFRPAGDERWRRVERTRSRADGRFRFLKRQGRTGAWRAVPRGGEASRVVGVSVRARIGNLRVKRGVMVGERGRVAGVVVPRTKRRVQVRVGSGTRSTRTDSAGRFRVGWRAGSPGPRQVTVRAGANSVSQGAQRRAGRVHAFRAGHASYYGPGFYGGRTACGQTLTPSTQGVAHKTLPCGTRVTFRYNGRQATVRVIDRGPFIPGRDWDLTSATRSSLGFPSTGTVLADR